MHALAVRFESEYMAQWHVNRATAQCVQGFMDAVESPKALDAALRVNPHHVYGQSCIS